MIPAVENFKRLFSDSFIIDDMQGLEMLIATAVSHKAPHSEMLWLRLIGASGSGKTEFLRTLVDQSGYCEPMESITPSAVRRGYIPRKTNKKLDPFLLERLNGKLAITKEFSSILSADLAVRRQLYGLLRPVFDGRLDADYGSDQGHLVQKTNFDWIIGTTSYVDTDRELEADLGSRFIDLRWITPRDREGMGEQAVTNDDGRLSEIRERLVRAMASIINNTSCVACPHFDDLSKLGDLLSRLRTPVKRDGYRKEVIDLPELEAPTRTSQAMNRIAVGLLMIGVSDGNIKPYLNRLVLDSMTRIRADVIRAKMAGLITQAEIAARLKISQGAISRILEDLRVIEWDDSMIQLLNGGNHGPEPVQKNVPPGLVKESHGLIERGKKLFGIGEKESNNE